MENVCIEKKKKKKRQRETRSKGNRISRSSRPPPQADIEPKRLSEEAFSRLHGSGVLVSEFKVLKDRGDHALEFHLGDVAPHAGPRAGAEGNKSILLSRGEPLLGPAVGDKVVGVGTPDLLAVVDRVARHAQRRARGEVVSQNLDALRVWVFGSGAGNETRQAERGRAVDPHRLVDHPLYVRKVLDGVVAGDAGGDVFVEFLLERLENARGAHDVVQDRAGRVAGRVGAGDELRERFGGEFFAAQLLALGVFAFHQACEEVDPVGGRVVQALLDPCDGDAR